MSKKKEIKNDRPGKARNFIKVKFSNPDGTFRILNCEAAAREHLPALQEDFGADSFEVLS